MAQPSGRPRWRERLERVGAPVDPRLSFANERTVLAWQRTALTLIGAGLAASQLLKFGFDAGRLIVGLPMIVLGGLVGAVGVARWRERERALRLRLPMPRRLLAPALLGLGTTAIALACVVLLTADQVRR
jgi:putative membrane protein